MLVPLAENLQHLKIEVLGEEDGDLNEHKNPSPATIPVKEEEAILWTGNPLGKLVQLRKEVWLLGRMSAQTIV